MFAAVVVSTDSPEIAEIARHYGAEVPFLRPAELAGDLSPDIEWVRYTLDGLGGRPDGASTASACCGPPARSAGRRRSAGRGRSSPSAGEVDSLRAVELCRQHPGKMWVVEGDQRMRPLLHDGPAAPPWHSRPYQALPQVIRPERQPGDRLAAHRAARPGPSPATAIVPFFTEGYEGFDVNEPKDWWYAEHLLSTGRGEPAARHGRAVAPPRRAAVTVRCRAASTCRARSSRGSAARRRSGAARAALVRRALPDQHALHDRPRRLRPHRQQLQQPRHRLLAASRGDARRRRPGECDIFFSSKGHDVPGLYAVLIGLGRLPFEQLPRAAPAGRACPAIPTSAPPAW